MREPDDTIAAQHDLHRLSPADFGTKAGVGDVPSTRAGIDERELARFARGAPARFELERKANLNSPKA